MIRCHLLSHAKDNIFALLSLRLSLFLLGISLLFFYLFFFFFITHLFQVLIYWQCPCYHSLARCLIRLSYKINKLCLSIKSLLKYTMLYILLEFFFFHYTLRLLFPTPPGPPQKKKIMLVNYFSFLCSAMSRPNVSLLQMITKVD